jgi:hypothetical protein
MQAYLELRYDCGEQGIPIARTRNPDILRLVKSDILRRAKTNAEESGQVDEVIGAIELAEFSKLERVLGMLIPNNVEL